MKKGENVVEKYNKSKRRSRWITAAILAVLALFVIVFLLSWLLMGGFGSFTVDLDYLDKGTGMSLSETQEFVKETSRLTTPSLKHADNITITDLEVLDLDSTDGFHNADNYFGYTFYVKNKNTYPISYNITMELVKAAKGAEEAVRILLISDTNEYGAVGNERLREVFAMATVADRTIAEPNTIAFENATTVFSRVKENVQPEAIHKYTVIIFLEGEDPECVDNIKGGMAKFAMKISQIA